MAQPKLVAHARGTVTRQRQMYGQELAPSSVRPERPTSAPVPPPAASGRGVVSPVVVAALRRLPSVCRFHGTDFERLGVKPWGEPRCDSCKDPWHRRKALRVITGSDEGPGNG